MTYTPTLALYHLRALAATAVPNCVNLDAIDRVVAATTFTEASTDDALLILDDALTGNPTTETLLLAIDYAVQKLRPVAPPVGLPVHDAAALAQLAKAHPIELPWMQEGGEQV